MAKRNKKSTPSLAELLKSFGGPKVTPEQGLSETSKMLDILAPLPSANPNDLVPGVASLPDVKTRIESLLPVAPIVRKAAPRRSAAPSVKQQAGAIAPQESNQPLAGPGEIPSLTDGLGPLPELLPLAPRQRLQSSDLDPDMQAIMDAKSKLRERQMLLAGGQQDPWTQALVGLGGLAGDVIMKRGSTPLMNQATAAYAAPFEQRRALLLKALEGSVADQDQLLRLAQARQNREAAFENQKALLGMRTQAPKVMTDSQRANLLKSDYSRFQADPIVRPSEQNLASLRKAKAVLENKNVPLTEQMLSDVEQDIASALQLRGLGATEGKIKRAELVTLLRDIAKVKTRVTGQPVDLREFDPNLVKQIQKMNQALIDDYIETLKDRANIHFGQAATYSDDPSYQKKVNEMKNVILGQYTTTPILDVTTPEPEPEPVKPPEPPKPKTVIKTMVSPSTGALKVIYSDGSEEVKWK